MPSKKQAILLEWYSRTGRMPLKKLAWHSPLLSFGPFQNLYTLDYSIIFTFWTLPEFVHTGPSQIIFVLDTLRVFDHITILTCCRHAPKLSQICPKYVPNKSKIYPRYFRKVSYGVCKMQERYQEGVRWCQEGVR